MILNPANVPSSLHALLPYAQRWGVGDDYERDTIVEEATAQERSELIHCIDPYKKELFDWLAGAEAASTTPTAEYVAYTNLTLAIDYAKALGSE